MKELKPLNGGNRSEGGELTKCEHYVAIGTQDTGFVFKGVYKNTFKKTEPNDAGVMTERQTHYFVASEDGEYFKLNKQRRAEKKSYQAGQEVGINGTKVLNEDYMPQITKGTPIIIEKVGEQENKSGKGTTQLIKVSAGAVEQTGPRLAATGTDPLGF